MSLVPGFYYDSITGKYYRETAESKAKAKATKQSIEIESIVNKKRSLTPSISQVLASQALGKGRVEFSNVIADSTTGKVESVSLDGSYPSIIGFQQLSAEIFLYVFANGMFSVGEFRSQSHIVMELSFHLRKEAISMTRLNGCKIGEVALITSSGVDLFKANSRGTILPGRKINTSGYMNDVLCCAYSKNSSEILISSVGEYWSHNEQTSHIRRHPISDKSGILSLLALGNTVYCGGRNGKVYYCDSRIKAAGSKVLNGGAPVTCLKSTDDFHLYLSRLDGQIQEWDLRFPRFPLQTMQSANNFKNTSFDIVRSYIFIATDRGLLNCWNLNNSQQLAVDRWGGDSNTRAFVQYDEAQNIVFICPEDATRVCKWSWKFS